MISGVFVSCGTLSRLMSQSSIIISPCLDIKGLTTDIYHNQLREKFGQRIQKWIFMNSWNDPIHPGEILGDMLEAARINASSLALRIGVTKNRLYQILNGKRSITAETAILLGRFFGTSAEFWLNLQQKYDLELAVGKMPKQRLRQVDPLSDSEREEAKLAS